MTVWRVVGSFNEEGELYHVEFEELGEVFMLGGGFIDDGAVDAQMPEFLAGIC